jgi:hypothetical protein
VGWNVGPVALHYAGVLVLIAGDAAKAEIVEDLLLDVLFKHLPQLLVLIDVISNFVAGLL